MNFPDPNLPRYVIIDDSEDDAFLLRHHLRAGEIANPVDTFASSAMGLAYLISLYGGSPPPGVVFIDIKMPGGFELIETLRDDSRFDETKIVVITYSNHPEDLQHALELRADAYILKFPDPDILADFLQHGPWFVVPRRVVPAAHALCA